jgi:hypothetical protein
MHSYPLCVLVFVGYGFVSILTVDGPSWMEGGGDRIIQSPSFFLNSSTQHTEGHVSTWFEKHWSNQLSVRTVLAVPRFLCMCDNA